MNILFVDLGNVWGGQEVYSQSVAIGLVEHGHTVTIASVHRKHEIIGNRYIRLRKGFLNFPLNLMKIWIMRNDFDVLHFNGLRSIYFGSLVKSKKIKVYSKHLPEPRDTIGVLQKLRLKIIYSILFRFSSGIAISKEIQEQLSVNRVPSTLIENGVHDMSINNKSQPKNENGIVYVGRLEEHKGLLLLLQALDKMKKNGVSFTCDIVGDGPFKAKMAEFIQENNLIDNISFIGHVDDPSEFYMRNRVFVLLSKHEGLPLSILEAFSCSCAVIAADIKAIRDIVDDQITGILVDRDASQVARSLSMVLGSSHNTQQIAQAARKAYESRWTVKRMVDEHIKFYEHLLHK